MFHLYPASLTGSQSKECQKFSWKTSHKDLCTPHPSLLQSADGTHVSPAKYSPEWHQMKIDKDLSKWLSFWRDVFSSFATIALDLANHGLDRVVTHCAVIAVAATASVDLFANTRYALTFFTLYALFERPKVVQATVERYKSVQEDYPQITPTPVNDYTRLRLLVILVDDDGRPLRFRLIQWNNGDLAWRRSIPKQKSRQLADGWAEALTFCVLREDPQDVERKLGVRRPGPDAPRPSLPANHA